MLGHHLTHTKSPELHRALFEMAGFDGEYGVMDIPPEEIRREAFEGLSGFNVTIPYKADIIPFLDECDEDALRYNAVNCVSIKDGKLFGHNTDRIGYLNSVKKLISTLEGKRVIILGCGGAGRMMALETKSSGAEVFVKVRCGRQEYYREMLGDGINVICDEAEGLGFDLAVNATPVGMFPDNNGCPASEKIKSRCEAAFDAVYNPTPTVFIKMFIENGKYGLCGMSMLVGQAAAAHGFWGIGEYTEDSLDELVCRLEEETT